jgi:hypothetical protein
VDEDLPVMMNLRMWCMHVFSQLKDSFANQIRKLVDHYKICVEKRGEYVEK